jgi:hypothetical protein
LADRRAREGRAEEGDRGQEQKPQLQIRAEEDQTTTSLLASHLNKYRRSEEHKHNNNT